MDCIYLLRVWTGSIGIVYCSEECYRVLLDFTFLSIEHKTVFSGSGHEVV